ncbi:hypothetical protein MO867_19675 [Microbulbifer sp. OS29]|uniref:Uncharacterized protein n=1 Tax=Microbulbifer okhotskensis TaxID=2926617 RepID=A0A9X2J869_9GAMM|nr:hypothetical protein [Microbulbifer okhotskensis]MCO1336555.1 hypothetical protein [Microbulbifer okhotskensis]
MHRFDYTGALNKKAEVYTIIVYAKFLKRTIRVEIFKSIKGGKEGHALLYSTHTHRTGCNDTDRVLQIEFLFRDAKQHTGLAHCQSIRKEAINMHVNESLVALNLLKIEDRNAKQTDEATVISIASWKRRKFNKHIMDRISDELDLDQSFGKVARIYERYSDYGAIAA